MRRLVKDGQLTRVPDTRPLRIDAASVHEYLERLIEDGPQLPDGVAGSGEAAPDLPVTEGEVQAALRKKIGELEHKVQELEEDNERLRNTCQGLRQAHGILLDNLGEFTSPKIPNN